MNNQANITAAWLELEFPDLTHIQPLQQGGQKQVFSATHIADGAVVLKLMLPNQDFERTTREVIAVAQVQSARVPKILDTGTLQTPIGQCYWFREQFIQGETVRECLTRGAFDKVSLLKLGLHLLETLAAAEKVRIVHRDVKPENIICDSADAFWLIDFGLARHLGLESLTATAHVFGNATWGYAPPEQCRNIKPEIDARADLFALGVTLYECASGVNPFREHASNALEILRRVENLQLPPLSMQFTNANAFSDFVMTLTQKRRDHRPNTAHEALEWMQLIYEEAQI